MTSDDLRKDLVERVRDALPALQFSDAVANDYGEDNFVLELDRTWIVRVPRDEANRRRFAAELRLLPALRTVSPLAVPVYEHIASDGSMGAYRRIDGAEMTQPVFARLGAAAQAAALDSLGAFLGALRRLPMGTIRQRDGSIQRCWKGGAGGAFSTPA